MRAAGLQRWTRNLILGSLLIFVTVALAGGTHRQEKPKTPLAAYQKQVNDMIGARWYALVEKERDMIAVGKVTINFRILADGRITNLKIVGNSSNESFANVSIRAVLEPKLPPIPEAVRRQLHQDFIDWDGVNFILYPN